MTVQQSPTLGGWIPAAPAVAGYSIRVLNANPLTTEWYQAPSTNVSSVAGKTGAVTLVHGDITDWTSTLAPYAPLSNPALGGVPTAPTAPPGTSTTQLATCAFVTAATVAATTGVASFNTRTGSISLTNADVVAVLPSSGGTPNADGVANAGSSTLWSRADHVHPTDTTRASVGQIPTPGVSLPLANGAASAGVTLPYSREDHTHPSDPSRVALAGGTMTGLLILSADPVAALGAATKQYADNVSIDMGTY